MQQWPLDPQAVGSYLFISFSTTSEQKKKEKLARVKCSVLDNWALQIVGGHFIPAIHHRFFFFFFFRQFSHMFAPEKNMKYDIPLLWRRTPISSIEQPFQQQSNCHCVTSSAVNLWSSITSPNSSRGHPSHPAQPSRAESHAGTE